MRVAPRDVDRFLASPDRAVRAFLFYGFDQSLALERLKVCAGKLGSGTGEKLDAVEIERGEVDLADSLSQPGLFAKTAVLQLDDAHKVADKIVDALNRTSPAEAPTGSKNAPGSAPGATAPKTGTVYRGGVYLLCRSASLRKYDRLLGYFTGRPDCAAIACYADEGYTLERFVQDYFRAHGVDLNRRRVSEIASRLGEDRQRNRLELEKLRLYGKDIDEALKATTFGEAEAELYRLVRECYAGRFAEAHGMAEGLLKRDRNDGVAILRLLCRHALRLYRAKAIMAEGGGEAEAIAKLDPPVFFREKPAFIGQLRSIDVDRLQKIVDLTSAGERDLKTGVGEADLTVQRALFDIRNLLSAGRASG